MTHPLCGADLATLARLFRAGGPPSRGRLGTAAMIFAAALARAPSTLLENRLTRRRLAAMEMPPPLVILGHWRSGTTHLANILAASGRFAIASPVAVGMPWDMLGLARLTKPLLERALPEGRYIDKVAVTPDSPQEDELALASMAPLSFYHGIYFPRRFRDALDAGLFFEGASDADRQARLEAFELFARKCCAAGGGRPVLVKNPVYTAYPALIRDVFPDAKFVHIHRNPYDVIVSMRNFYAKLLEALALQPFDHIDIDETNLAVYAEMMARFSAETRDWAPPHLAEVGYDALNADPIGTIQNVFETLRIDGFDAAEGAMRTYLDGVGSYEKNRFPHDPALAARVEEVCAPYLDRWGYRVPTAAALAAA